MIKDEFEKILLLYENDIYSLCMHLTENKHQADDLFQDTFLEVFKKIEKLETESNIKSYMVGAVYFVWKANKRKWKRRNSIAKQFSIDEYVEQALYICDDKATGIDNYVADKAEYEDLRKEVKNLKNSYRVIIEMYYALEMTTKEIAKALNIPKGTVESRLHRARTVLKKRMEELGYER